MSENEVVVMPEEKAVAVFSKFNKELETKLAESKSVVHDITTKKGNKEARSFVADLRKSKKPVIDTHKEGKAESLEYGRFLDKEKNRIIAAIDEAIEVHTKPLAELEASEEKRIDEIKIRVEQITNLSNAASVISGTYNSEQLNESLVILQAIEIDDSFDEFKDLAEQSKASSLTALEALIATVTEQEKKDAELARLQAAEAERVQKERDDQIREDARLVAEKAAEAALQAEKDAVIERELALEQQAETHKRQQLESEQQAEAEKQQALNDERERIAQENREKEEVERLEKEAEERKAANKNHQRAFNNEALAGFTANGILNGKEIIELIAQGKIKNITINY